MTDDWRKQDELTDFWAAFDQNAAQRHFIKLTLSKPFAGSADWTRLSARPVEIDGRMLVQLLYTYSYREETRNLPLDEAREILQQQLGDHFGNGDLFGLHEHISLQLSRKRRARINRGPARHERPADTTHDRARHRRVDPAADYLRLLGITTAEGVVKPDGKRKYRQIEKFVEILDGLIKEQSLPEKGHILDMGSGKGYLTFALYDFLTRQAELKIRVTGVEIRADLVAKCNKIAGQCGFTGLTFTEGAIDAFPDQPTDLLIALHACDTATDDALAYGLRNGAATLVVAPCCQKQVRRDLDPPSRLRPLLRHGILLERQAAMLTDALRALYLERAGYRTKLFEFIPLEHTAKNVMITAQRATHPRTGVQEEITALKEDFGLKRHYLEEILS